MNDDYLWDKSGQPDPEIQQLEQILGTLRYQPKPLVIPRRNSFAWLAIAASLLLALLAGGIWLRVRSHNEAPPQQARIETPKPVQAPQAPRNESALNPPLPPSKRIHKPRSASSVLPKAEREEALMAKEQLMLALRLTTQKLHLVHIKTQHKVG